MPSKSRGAPQRQRQRGQARKQKLAPSDSAALEATRHWFPRLARGSVLPAFIGVFRAADDCLMGSLQLHPVRVTHRWHRPLAAFLVAAVSVAWQCIWRVNAVALAMLVFALAAFYVEFRRKCAKDRAKDDPHPVEESQNFREVSSNNGSGVTFPLVFTADPDELRKDMEPAMDSSRSAVEAVVEKVDVSMASQASISTTDETPKREAQSPERLSLDVAHPRPLTESFASLPPTPSTTLFTQTSQALPAAADVRQPSPDFLEALGKSFRPPAVEPPAASVARPAPADMRRVSSDFLAVLHARFKQEPRVAPSGRPAPADMRQVPPDFLATLHRSFRSKALEPQAEPSRRPATADMRQVSPDFWATLYASFKQREEEPAAALEASAVPAVEGKVPECAPSVGPETPFWRIPSVGTWLVRQGQRTQACLVKEVKKPMGIASQSDLLSRKRKVSFHHSRARHRRSQARTSLENAIQGILSTSPNAVVNGGSVHLIPNHSEHLQNSQNYKSVMPKHVAENPQAARHPDPTGTATDEQDEKQRPQDSKHGTPLRLQLCECTQVKACARGPGVRRQGAVPKFDFAATASASRIADRSHVPWVSSSVQDELSAKLARRRVLSEGGCVQASPKEDEVPASLLYIKDELSAKLARSRALSEGGYVQMSPRADEVPACLFSMESELSAKFARIRVLSEGRCAQMSPREDDLPEKLASTSLPRLGGDGPSRDAAEMHGCNLKTQQTTPIAKEEEALAETGEVFADDAMSREDAEEKAAPACWSELKLRSPRKVPSASPDSELFVLQVELDACECELATLTDRLEHLRRPTTAVDKHLNRRTELASGYPEWRTACQDLVDRLRILSSDALECSCDCDFGAMDVFQQANLATEQLATLLQQGVVDASAPARCNAEEWRVIANTIGSSELQLLRELLLKVHDCDKHPASLSDGKMLNQSPATMLRFLRARNGNVEKAENMFRNSLHWRWTAATDKEHELWTAEERAAETWRAKLAQEFKVHQYLGQDRFGLPVYLFRWSVFDVAGAERELGTAVVVQIMISVHEEIVRAMGIAFLQHQIFAPGCMQVWDVGNYGIHGGANWWSRMLALVRFLPKVAKIIEQNYPEVIRKIVIVRSSATTRALYRTLTPFMPAATMDKGHLFGWSPEEWMKEIQEEAPKLALPPFLCSNDEEALAKAEPRGGMWRPVKDTFKRSRPNSF